MTRIRLAIGRSRVLERRFPLCCSGRTFDNRERRSIFTLYHGRARAESRIGRAASSATPRWRCVRGGTHFWKLPALAADKTRADRATISRQILLALHRLLAFHHPKHLPQSTPDSNAPRPTLCEFTKVHNLQNAPPDDTPADDVIHKEKENGAGHRNHDAIEI